MTLVFKETPADVVPEPWENDPTPGFKPKKWPMADWQERELRARYNSKTETITELAKRFGVPRWVARRWAQQLGLARTKEPRWTDAHVAYLERHWSTENAATIARRLGRTLTAVSLKAKRLELRKGEPGYTMRQLEVALGEDHKKIQRWIESGALKASRRNTFRKPQQGGDTWLFREDDVRDFIRRHPLEISLRKVDQLWFIEEMLGIRTDVDA